MEMNYSLHSSGESAVIIQLGNHISIETQQKMTMITSVLEQSSVEWLIEYIPSYTTVAIFYNPLKVKLQPHESLLPYNIVCRDIRQILYNSANIVPAKPKEIEILVCYGGDFGPDLTFIAAYNHLTIEEVINIHANGKYLVHMIGFSPGFPYIGGISEKIAAPWRKTPRIKIPARSIGIAGKQTGIYSIETPGGWQIIGRTPIDLFRPEKAIPSLLQAGDHVKFKPISLDKYILLEEKEG